MFMDVGSLGTSPSVENAHAMIARGLCHLVIERLPDAALAEVMESLKTLFEFYNTRRQQAIPLPPPRRVLPARVTSRQERRPLSIDEE